MGTPFISLQEPANLDGWARGVAHDAQAPERVPGVFRDAMEVREAVFVGEQGVPLAHEVDADDARSCHWVMYASVNRTTEPEVRDPDSGEILRPRRSVTRSQPIATLRVVPFPHPPHPVDGAWYVDNELQEPPPSHQHQQQQQQQQASTAAAAAPPAASPTGAAQPGSRRQSAASAPTTLGPTYEVDRETTFHDGREPYVKVGRLAVVREFRGHRVGAQVWAAARRWLEAHPAYFNPSVAELGLDRLGAATLAPGEVPKWRGLVLAHAQESVAPLWERWGFRRDHALGRWFEEGIPHVGMALRLDVDRKPSTAAAAGAAAAAANPPTA